MEGFSMVGERCDLPLGAADFAGAAALWRAGGGVFFGAGFFDAAFFAGDFLFFAMGSFG
ncbi:MAG: hypothetical protein Q7S40_20290 [Opitutaceae bacterium]|nr:hypothetical protein [Opitutaceae bacterium]